MTTRRTLRYPAKISEGDWYAIPLRNGGYGVGIVARKGEGRILFGYFFGPRRPQPPVLEDVRQLRAEDALFCKMFGDLGIHNGEWPFVGRLETWSRDDWPFPLFSRIEDESRGIAWIVSYDENDLTRTGTERRCTLEEARRLPSSALAGYGAVEIVLTKKLSNPATTMQ